MTTVAPLLTLWEIVRPTGAAQLPPPVRLTSSPPVRPQQTPYPRRAIWIDGKPWYCTGIGVSGVERTIGAVPTIRLRVQLDDDLRARQQLTPPLISEGAMVTRYQVDARAADGINWPEGTNPYTATPERVDLRTDCWVVSRITRDDFRETEAEMQNESASWTAVVRPDVPGRCYHRYRGTACGYTGDRYFDRANQRVDTLAEDACALSISACELRFPTGPLPFGGLPQDLGGESR